MDQEGPPPKYGEVFPMKNVEQFDPIIPALDYTHHSPSAPGLANVDFATLSGIESLDNIMIEMPRTIKFENGPTPSTVAGGYEFYIRGLNDVLFATGTISSEGLKLQNISGLILMQIIPEASIQGAGYCIRHRNIQLGSLTMEEGEPLSVRIFKSYENRNYTVNFVTATDVMISRTWMAGGADTICKIHIPEPASNTSSTMNGTLVISESETVTVIEQCLAISVALVHMMTRNELMKAAISEKEAFEIAKLACLCFVVIFVTLIVAYICYAYAKKKPA